MIGSKGKMEIEPDSDELWQDYGLAAQKAKSDYENEIAATQERLSAGGAKEGDKAWTSAMQDLDVKYQQTQQSLQSTPQYQMLNRRWGATQMRADQNRYGQNEDPDFVGYIARANQNRINAAREFAGKKPTQDFSKPGVTMEQYYESQYGQPQQPVMQKDQVAIQNQENPGRLAARRGASGGRSSWW